MRAKKPKPPTAFSGALGDVYREVASLFPGRPVLARVAAGDLGLPGRTILDVAVLRPDYTVQVGILVDATDRALAAARRALGELPILGVTTEAYRADPVAALHRPLAAALQAWSTPEEAPSEPSAAWSAGGSHLPRSGLTELDRRMGPLEPGDLVLVGGLTGMGKSSFLRHLALENAVRQSIPTLLVALEAGLSRTAADLVLAQLRMDGARLRVAASAEEQERLREGFERLRRSPLVVATQPDLTPSALEGLVHCHASGPDPVRLVLLDCLELVGGESPAAAARRLKLLARRVDAAVVAATNGITSTRVTRPDGRPALPDLGDLGAHADKVVLMHREKLYEMRTDNAFVTELLVAKNRGGPKGLVNVAYFEETRSLADLEVSYDAQDAV